MRETEIESDREKGGNERWTKLDRKRYSDTLKETQ